MKGMDLSERYFEVYGRPMLSEFPELAPHVAAGILGSGSECFGFDDEVSRDHDFEPGFCLFLPGEDAVDRRSAFLLERAYAKLPKEFEGVKRQILSPVGGNRHGVIRIADFLKEKTGEPDGRLSAAEWLRIPEQFLAEVVNGKLFWDPSGEMTRIRAELAFFPEDIFLKKLAGQLFLMGQSGQYNYRRCLAHGETGAAQLSVFEFVNSTMSAVFLLNGRYRPYYKWSFRAMRQLPRLSLTAELLEYLITTDNDGETAEEKYNVMEGIASDVIGELTARGLSDDDCPDLEKHARLVNDHIRDPEIRNM